MNIKDTLKRINPSGWIVILAIILLIELIIQGAIYVNSKLDRIGFEAGEDDEWSAEIGKLEHINVLLLGTDERAPDGGIGDFGSELLSNARADACMVLSLDMKNHTAHLVSLERAIGVKIEENGEDWLTHVFSYGGADAMLKTVREQLGVDVHRYVRVNVGVAADLIDAIGGVDITLTETEAAALNGEIYSNSVTKHHVVAGLNHLDGFDAIAYARQRFIDSDFQRVQRQRNVIQAAIDQTKTLSLKQIDNLLNVALPLVQTNFTKKDISTLIPKAPAFLGVKLEQMTMPIKGMYGKKLTDDGRSMMMLDPQESTRILDEFFYGCFDPDTYVASDEVQSRVWQAQQQAQAEWEKAHPVVTSQQEQTVDSGISSDTQAAPETDEEVSPPDEEQSVSTIYSDAAKVENDN